MIWFRSQGGDAENIHLILGGEAAMWSEQARKNQASMVLLHNSGFCNGYITQRIFTLSSFPFIKKINIIQPRQKTLRSFYYFNLLLLSNCETRSLYDIILELSKNCFVVQPLQIYCFVAAPPKPTKRFSIYKQQKPLCFG